MVSMGRALLFLDRLILAAADGRVRQFPINAETLRERLNINKQSTKATAMNMYKLAPQAE